MNRHVGFYVLGAKGFECLKWYLSFYNPNTVDFVSVGRDKGIDNDYYTEILELCKSSSINVVDRDKVSLKRFSQDILRFAIGWKWIIEETYNLVIFHDSLLPKYRGFAPVVNALISGERTIGVTALWASDDYDVGDIISQRKIDINYPAKIQNVIDQITPLYMDLLKDIAHKFHSGLAIKSIKQVEADATYSVWRDHEDYEIPWSLDSNYIKRFVDAVGAPYEGATSFLKGKMIKIHDVEVKSDIVISDRERHIGKVIKVEDNKPVIICGQGLIKVIDFKDLETQKQPEFNFRSRFGV